MGGSISEKDQPAADNADDKQCAAHDHKCRADAIVGAATDAVGSDEVHDEIAVYCYDHGEPIIYSAIKRRRPAELLQYENIQGYAYHCAGDAGEKQFEIFHSFYIYSSSIKACIESSPGKSK